MTVPAPGVHRIRQKVSALLLLSLLLLVFPSTPADPSSGEDTVDPERLEWWGGTTVGDGFHIRFPVTVQNHRDHPVENGLVLAEVDVAKKLVEAGWVSQPRSGTDLLRSFELDGGSVRVVAMTDLEPREPGTTHGLLGRFPLTDAPSDDPRRSEVPSTHFKGFLSEQGDTFDNRTDPRLTVMWRVPGVLDPGDERHYVVYLDSTTNRDGTHAPPDYRDVPGGPLLERTFWSGPGTDLSGFVAPPTGQAGTLTVIGLHDDTEVEILVGDISSGTFQKQPPQPVTHDTNPFGIDAYGFRRILISSQGEPTAVRLLASKPVLALADGEGYVPTVAGETIGAEFLFATTHRPSDGQDSLFFYNHNPSPLSDQIEKTVVQLERLEEEGGEWMEDQVVHLTDSQNLLPYTLGSRGEGDPSPGDCSFEPTGRMAVVEPGYARYRARVTEGGPVSLQLQPTRGLTQLPAVDGAPWGTGFWSVLNRVSADGSTCGDVRQHLVYATSPSLTDLGLSNPESSSPLIQPPCDGEHLGDCEDWYPVGPLPGPAINATTFDTTDFRERPIRFHAGGSTALMVAPPPAPGSLADTPLRGPLGGDDAGRGFAGYGSKGGPPLLFAPFGGTSVEARIQYAASGTHETSISLVGGKIEPLPEEAGDPILSYHLESDRPVIVLPRGASTGFLAGTPPTLEAVVHAADYRGHLVEIRSTTGLDPVSASTVPGEPVTYDFTVTNRGRGADGADLDDTVAIRLTDVPEGWEADLSRKTLPLSSGESGSVRLTITPGEDAEPGELASVSVEATSVKNPRVTHAVDTVTNIKRSFDVGIWFDRAEVGPKIDRRSGEAGEPVNYTVVVQNSGTVDDRILLEVASIPGDEPWGVQLLHDGEAVDEIDLEARGSAVLTLSVAPPPDTAQGALVTNVKASSGSSPSATDSVTARTSIRAPSNLSLDLEDPTQWVEPGGQAVFNFTLRNDGGAATVTFDARADRLPGWTEPELSVWLSGNQSRRISSITIDSEEEWRFAVAINASRDATAGDRVTLRLQVGAEGQGQVLGEFLHAIVKPVHRIEAETPPLPLDIPRGGAAVPVEVRITNNGSMDERLVPEAAVLPPGWNLTFPTPEVFVPRNTTQNLRIGLEAPAGTPNGSYATAFAVTSRDGTRTEIDLPVRVGVFAGHALEGPARLEGQPGRTTWTEHTVRNDGNTPLQVRIEATEGEAWAVEGAGAPVVVPPGARATLRIGWHVPPDAPDGVGPHSADVVLVPDAPDLEIVRDPVVVDIDVGRPALRVVSASVFEASAGQIVRALVANDGARPAYDVVVELRAGGEPVGSAVLAELSPGSARNVTLLQPAGRAGEPSVVVDPGATVVESDRNDNVALVDAVESRDTPAPGAWSFLLLSMAALVRRWRDRHGAASPSNGPAMAKNDVHAVPPATGPMLRGSLAAKGGHTQEGSR